jgi:hypothetical protein
VFACRTLSFVSLYIVYTALYVLTLENVNVLKLQRKIGVVQISSVSRYTSNSPQSLKHMQHTEPQKACSRTWNITVLISCQEMMKWSRDIWIKYEASDSSHLNWTTLCSWKLSLFSAVIRKWTNDYCIQVVLTNPKISCSTFHTSTIFRKTLKL